MSTSVQVLPSTLVSVPYHTDRSIVSATDISTLYYNAGQVKNITEAVGNILDPDNLGVFKFTTNLSKEVGQGVLHEYEAGPLTFKFQLSKDGRLSLQTFFSPPLFANILMDSSYGTKKTGVSATIGPTDILDGSVVIKKKDSDFYLSYDITLKTFNKQYKGEIKLEFS